VISPDLAMQLTDEQKQKVAAWIAEGMKLSDIQGRLGDEFDIRLTYMDARLLVDDLKLTPKDAPQPAAVVAPAMPAASTATQAAPSILADSAAPVPATKVALSVDQIARPGTLASGGVTFSDGKNAKWYLDQQGRLGLVPPEPGYHPPEGDVEQFQVSLDRELQKLGI
jgi:hypothetical protein